MVDKICDFLLEKIKKDDKTVDEEKAQIIYYGLQNMVGEFPKVIIILITSAVLGIFDLVMSGTIVLLIYRGFAGGVHLKTHLSCILMSSLVMIGGTYLMKVISFENTLYIYTLILLVNLLLVTLYAPADTENRPIMKETQRRRQKIECYITILIIYFFSAFVIKNQMYSNMFMYVITIESLMLTPLAYKIFDNKLGTERRNEILSSM